MVRTTLLADGQPEAAADSTLDSNRRSFGAAGWLAAAVVLLALALRLYRLDHQSFWGDEGFALRLAREPLDRLLPALAGSEPHPPLYYGLLHFWRDLAGESDFALRLLSTAFSVIGVAAVYGLGRQLGGRPAGLAAALLMAANPFQVWYAQETRMYGMLVGLTAWSALSFYGALRLGGKRRWCLYAAITGLAINSHYHALFVVAFENVVAALWWLRARFAARGWLATQAALFAVFLAWLAYAQAIFRSWTGWMPPADLGTVLTRTFSTQFLGTSFPPEWAGEAAVVLAAWVALSLAAVLWRRPGAGVFLALYVFLPLFGTWLLGLLLGRSMFHERYLIVVSPALYLIAGAGVGWRGWRVPLSLLGAGAVLALGAVALNNHYFDWRYQKDDLRGMARHIDSRGRDGDLVVASITRQWLYQRYAKLAVPLYLIPPDASPAKVVAALPGAAAGYRRLWYLPYARSDVDLAVDRWLAENAYPAQVRWFNTARTVLAGGVAEPRWQSGAVRFADGLRLDAYSLPAGPFTPGDVIPLALRWVVEQPAGGEIKASLRLLDARGHVYAQVDPPLGGEFRPLAAWPPGAPVRENHGLYLPVDSPPGEYRVELRLYDTAKMVELAVRDDRGTPLSAGLKLGSITVDRAGRPASPAAQEVPLATGATFGGLAILKGYDLPAGTRQAGERATVTLYWQALQPDGRDYRPVLSLVGEDDVVAAREYAQAAGGALPMARWRPGELVRDIHDWRLPRGLRAGSYALTVGVESSEGLPVPPQGGGTHVTIGRIAVAARPDYAPPAEPEHALNYAIGGFAKITGFDLSAPALRPGETLGLTLHWQVLAETDESVKVFTHLLSANERVWGQHDSIPCGGGCPTSGWAVGDSIADQYSLTVQTDTPPGIYRVEVGMYRPDDGRRLPIIDGTGRPVGDRIIFGEVRVR